MKHLSHKLTSFIGIVTILFATYLFYEIYRMTNKRLMGLDVQQVEMVLKFDLAIRDYIGRYVRPVMYQFLGEDEFIRETMSTSFVARRIFEDVNKDFPNAIIKFSSDNPRNPSNQAGPEELEIIKYFNEHPEEKSWSGQINIDGRSFWAKFRARRMETSCLRCHGDPKDAPRSMIEQYGNEAGFYRPIGEVIGTDTVAVPVSKMTEAIWSESLNTFLLLGSTVVLFFISITFIFRFCVTTPLSKISHHMSKAAALDSYKDIGNIQAPSRDEIGAVATSFNTLFSKLQGFYNLLEEKVAERTADLEKANKKLIQEIEVRKKTEQSLELTQFVIDHFSDPIYFIRPDGRIMFANRAAGERLGYSTEQLTQMTFSEVDPGFSKTSIVPLLKELRSQDTILFESYQKDKHGDLFPVEIKANLYSNHNAEYIFEIAHDISDHKKAQIEKQLLEKRLRRALKMEAIGTLAGGVAHDLNNVLSGVISYPEMILMGMPHDHELRRPIETILRSGQKAADIVQELLTMARRGVSKLKPVGMNGIIEDYVHSAEFLELKKSHPTCTVETLLDPNLFNIMGSEVHLSKTIMNLVTNALEAMPNGGALTISTENRYVDRTLKDYDDVEEGEYILLKVSDTGQGLSEEDKEKIFEPFYTKKSMGRSGTGLGMTVVWSTVKDHDGFIGIQSEIGSGTVFKLYFPATRKRIDEHISEFVLADHRGNGETILIVDDVLEQRQIATAILENLGYTIVAVPGGEEALEHLKDHRVDLVILDMIMDPGIDGLETFKRIVKIRPDQKAIIVSGFSEGARVKEVQRLGAGPYLRKPYTIEKLSVIVKTALLQ